MTAINYKHLALDWQPLATNSRNFNRILIAAVVVMALLAIPLSLVKVPVEKKHQRAAVPERIADFISRKEKPVVPPKPQPKPVPPPLPKIEPIKQPEKNDVVKEITRQRDKERKSLTESEMRARKVAENSGLLALANQLNDLIDTKEASAALSKNLSAKGGDDATKTAGLGTDAISSAVNQSGGRIDAGHYGNVASNTVLEARATGQDFAERKSKIEAKTTASKNTGGMSAEENVTMVFDKNKGSLYSLYERERRVTQGIQGKIVLQLTISPAGDVTEVKILSSELNSPELEAKIVSRVKTFKFTISGDKPITLNYPIEFLPS